MPAVDSTPRTIARAVLVAAAVVIFLYILYLLRKPLSWIFIAAFIAMAAAGGRKCTGGDRGSRSFPRQRRKMRSNWPALARCQRSEDGP